MIDHSNNLEKALVIIDLCLASTTGIMKSKYLAKVLDTTPRTIRRIFHIIDNMSYELKAFTVYLSMAENRFTEDSYIRIKLK